MDKTVKYTRNGNQPMAFVRIEDLRGPIEVVVFPKDYEKYASSLLANQVVIVEGKANVSDDETAKLAASKIEFISTQGTLERKNSEKNWYCPQKRPYLRRDFAPCDGREGLCPIIY